MRIHFISIGGSVMHQLAIALSKKGYFITGSDDEIFEPSKGNLERAGLYLKEWVGMKAALQRIWMRYCWVCMPESIIPN